MKKLTKTDIAIGYAAHVDPRKEKRYWRKSGFQRKDMYEAHCSGEADGHFGKPCVSPFPPGRRTDEYVRSYKAAQRHG